MELKFLPLNNGEDKKNKSVQAIRISNASMLNQIKIKSNLKLGTEKIYKLNNFKCFSPEQKYLNGCL